MNGVLPVTPLLLMIMSMSIFLHRVVESGVIHRGRHFNLLHGLVQLRKLKILLLNGLNNC